MQSIISFHKAQWIFLSTIFLIDEYYQIHVGTTVPVVEIETFTVFLGKYLFFDSFGALKRADWFTGPLSRTWWCCRCSWPLQPASWALTPPGPSGRGWKRGRLLCNRKDSPQATLWHLQLCHDLFKGDMSFVKLNGHPFGLHREVLGARHGDSFSTGWPVPEKASGETGPSTPPLIALLEAGKWTDYPEISGMSSQCIQELNKTLPAGMVQLGRLQYSHLKVSISTTGTVNHIIFYIDWVVFARATC